jgi:hypothetical protein
MGAALGAKVERLDLARRLGVFLWGAGAVALAASVGADARWLAALGATIVHTGRIPQQIPFASAPTQAWHDVPVLAELVFYALTRVGDRGLIAAQALAVGLTFLLSTGRRSPLWPVLVATVALYPELAVARNDMFSLPLFAAFAALFHRDSAAPFPALWVVVPLVALWSNLHGAVLAGLGLLAVYVIFDGGGRPARVRLALLATAVLAVFATPALWHTGSYYAGVLRSEAVRRREGLWEPLSPTSGFSWLMVVGALVLLLAGWRQMLRYELVAALGLALAAIRSERMGVWLVLLALAAASRRAPRAVKPRTRSVALAAMAGAGGAALVLGLAGAPSGAADAPAVRAAIRLARGSPILADPELAERVALAGGRVWISNPLDAFRRSAQTSYLDWVAGRPDGDRLLRRSAVVVTRAGSPSARRAALDRRFRVVSEAGSARVYVRSARPGG